MKSKPDPEPADNRGENRGDGRGESRSGPRLAAVPLSKGAEDPPTDETHLRYLLTAYLFGDITAAGRREVEDHLETCETCRLELERLRCAQQCVSELFGEAEAGDPSMTEPSAVRDQIRTARADQYEFEARRRERVMEAARRRGDGRAWRPRLIPARKGLPRAPKPFWRRSNIAALFLVGVLLVFFASPLFQVPRSKSDRARPMKSAEFELAEGSLDSLVSPPKFRSTNDTGDDSTSAAGEERQNGLADGYKVVPGGTGAVVREVAPDHEEKEESRYAPPEARNKGLTHDAPAEGMPSRAARPMPPPAAKPKSAAPSDEGAFEPAMDEKSVEVLDEDDAESIEFFGYGAVADRSTPKAGAGIGGSESKKFESPVSGGRVLLTRPDHGKAPRFSFSKDDRKLEELHQPEDSTLPRGAIDGRASREAFAAKGEGPKPQADSRVPLSSMTRSPNADLGREPGKAPLVSGDSAGLRDQIADKAGGDPFGVQWGMTEMRKGAPPSDPSGGLSLESLGGVVDFSRRSPEASGVRERSAPVAESYFEVPAPEALPSVNPEPSTGTGIQLSMGDAGNTRVMGEAGQPSLPTFAPSLGIKFIATDDDLDVVADLYLQPDASDGGASGAAQTRLEALTEAIPELRRKAVSRNLDLDGEPQVDPSQGQDRAALGQTGFADDPVDTGLAGSYELGLRTFDYFRRRNPELKRSDLMARRLVIPAPTVGDEGLGREGFRRAYGVNPFVDTRRDSLSTFSMDVDTASYTLARRTLESGRLPDPSTIRVEEFVNALALTPPPSTDEDFSVVSEGAPALFGDDVDLLRVAVRARDLADGERRAVRLTLAIDTSGSMLLDDRLALFEGALEHLLAALEPDDQLAIVGYGAEAVLVLPHTPVYESDRIRHAFRSLEPTGETNVEAGLSLAYRLAEQIFEPRALNRVMLVSDGVATAGSQVASEVLETVRGYASRGIFLSVVGCGERRYDDRFLETIADGGNGNYLYLYLDSIETARRFFSDELSSTIQVLALDAKIQVEFNPEVVSHYRLLGYENRDIADKDFRNDKIDAAEVGPGTTVNALFEIRRRPGRAGDLGTVRVRYRGALTQLIEELAFPLVPGVLVDDFSRTTGDYQLVACMAELAELLRQSYWARNGTFEALLIQLDRLDPTVRTRPEWRDLRAQAEQAYRLLLTTLSESIPESGG